MTDIAHFLQSVKLPVMPETAHALIRTLSDDDADVTTVTRIISKDPGLTATLLRMANSAIFGLSRSVTSLESAVSVVGMSHIRARALSICMANAFVFPAGLDRLEFWRSSMVCAGYAKWLASHTTIDEQQAWLTGMMLRLGEILIALRKPESLERIEAQPCSPAERWQRERELTGFDEGQISAEVARRWDFPEVVTLALESATQARPDPKFQLGAVVHLGALLSETSDTPAAKVLERLPVTMLHSLGLNAERLATLFPGADAFSDISMLQA